MSFTRTQTLKLESLVREDPILLTVDTGTSILRPLPLAPASPHTEKAKSGPQHAPFLHRNKVAAALPRPPVILQLCGPSEQS